MQPVITTLWSILETMLAITPLALAASFSPTLYATQLGVSTKQHTTLHRAFAPLVGTLGALVLMLVVFQFLHLDVLVRIIGSAASALIVSTAVAIIVGVLCIYGGTRLATRSRMPTSRPKATVTGNAGTLIWFGFIRTFFSVSGLAATFLGANVVAASNSGLVAQAALTCFFLIIASVPFLVVARLGGMRLPERASALFATVRAAAERLNYRLYAGITIIALGVIIILVQITQLLFA